MGDAGTIIGGVGAAAGGAASIAQILQGKEAADRAEEQLRQDRAFANQQFSSAQNVLNLQTGNAEALLREIGPLRSGVANTLRGVLTGRRPGAFRIFAPEREMVEQQFGRARENIIAGGQRGGQLNRSLTDLEIGRAQTLGGMESDIRRRGFEDALRVGFGAQPAVQFPGFPGGGNGVALSQLAQSQQSAGGAGLGSIAGIGALLALKQGQK